MNETRVWHTASNLCVGDRRMRYRRNAMLGCLGLLFAVAACGTSPREILESAWGMLPDALGEGSAFKNMANPGLFHPFWGEQGETECQTPEEGARRFPAGCRTGSWTRMSLWKGAGRASVSSSQISSNVADGRPCCIAGKAQAPVVGRGDRLVSSFGGTRSVISSDMTLSTASSWAYIQGRLRELGVSHYHLGPWGQEGGAYRFWCKVPMGEERLVARYFEAIDRDSAEAVNRVLAQIEAWRAGH